MSHLCGGLQHSGDEQQGSFQHPELVQGRLLADEEHREDTQLAGRTEEVHCGAPGKGSSAAGGEGEDSSGRAGQARPANGAEKAQVAQVGGNGGAVESSAQVADEKGEWWKWWWWVKGETPFWAAESQQQSALPPGATSGATPWSAMAGEQYTWGAISRGSTVICFLQGNEQSQPSKQFPWWP